MTRYPLRSEAVSTIPQPDGLLAAALRYTQAGWRVFPCKRAAKIPAIAAVHLPGDPARLTCHGECGRDGHGFWDATTDPAVIRAWWARWPQANVAIATGAPGPDVLDVDVKPDGNGFAAFNRLKRAGLLTGASTLVRTRSGGLHVYFTGTAQGCHALPRHHLDFKAAGGYVLAPPSYVEADAKGPAGAYELLDQRAGATALNWPKVAATLSPPRPPRPGKPARALPSGELPPGVLRALAAPAQDRSAALHRLVGACVRAGLDEAAIHELAGGYEPAIAKYGPRLHAEVHRSLTRIGTT
jgi:hypothetical protein